ncbi:MAG: metallophosphoesterase family protein [Rhizobiaceae bacterium]
MSVKVGTAHAGKKMRIYAIGDVHGCLDEMKDMLKLIKRDLKTRPIKHHRIVFVGDFVDRGPDSKGVVKYLKKLIRKNKHVTCLFGNHDEKLLLARKEMPLDKFDSYFRFGGAETMLSYGVSTKKLKRISDNPINKKAAISFAKKAKKRIPKSHVKFLKKLPRSITIGDYFICHAGVHPQVALDEQKEQDLIWIREPFLSWDRPLDKVIIHGHTRRSKPDVRKVRINVDTSCCYGGELTAVVLEGVDHHFLTVKARKKYWSKS